MKKFYFCAAALSVCCIANSSSAQIRVLGGQPTPAPRLVATQSEAEIGSDFDASPSMANPFDFGPNDSLMSAGDPPIIDQPPPFSQPLSNAPSDPQSLHVGKHAHGRQVVDAIIDHSTVHSVPHAGSVPINWCPGVMTPPNHVAQVMLRQSCVDGLWDGYAAERAAECARQWEHIAGKQHGCGCGRSCGGHCSAGVPGPGPSLCNKPRNRYLERAVGHFAKPACDAPAANCDAGAASNCDAGCTQCAANFDAAARTLPVSSTTPADPVNASDHKVALADAPLVR